MKIQKIENIVLVICFPLIILGVLCGFLEDLFYWLEQEVDKINGKIAYKLTHILRKL